MSRFSCGVAPRTSVTWSSQLLPKIVTTGVSAATSSRRFGSSSGRVRAVAGRAERGQLRRLPGHAAGGLEEVDVLGVRARPAALDVGHAVLVEHPGDAQLVGEGEGDVLALGAVAEGRVVERDGPVGGGHRPGAPVVRGGRRITARLAAVARAASDDPVDDRRGHARSSRPGAGRLRRRSGGTRSAVRKPSSRAALTAASMALAPHPRGRATSAAASPPTGSCRSGWRGRGRRCPARSRGSARTGRSVPCCGPRARRATPTAACRGCPARTAASSRQDVAEQVLGDDHVEVGGPADEQHRARVDELVVEGRRPG